MSYNYCRTFSHEGKRYYCYGDTLEEVAAKMALKKRDIAEGKIMTPSTYTVGAWLDECTRLYKRGVSEKTLEDFRYLSARVLEPIKSARLAQVKPMHLQSILNEYEGMSATQINAVMHVLRFVFGKAKLNGLIPTDPSDHLVKPTAKRKEPRRALTPHEREHIIAVGLGGKRKYLLFMLMLFCGCRPSEAARATGADISEQGGYHILHVRGTKTPLSDRYVPIPDKLYDAIKNTAKNDFIASYDNGNMITPMNRARLWQRFCRDVNLSMGAKTYRNALVPPLPLATDLVPYCLRHEYCTELARRGVDIRIAQRLMGHASIRMTAGVYTNLDNSDILAAAEIIGASKSTTQNTTP